MSHADFQGPTDGSHESLVTYDDILHAAEVCALSRTDPLAAFPPLQLFVEHSCAALRVLMLQREPSVTLVDLATKHAYAMATVVSLAMHRAIWNAVLPDESAAE